MEMLDFSAISKAVPFKNVLDYLNIQYKEEGREIKGENFIVNMDKNLYFNPGGKDRGSIINFWSHLKQTDLRTAAHAIKVQFLEQPKERSIPEYTLEYDHPFLRERGIAPEQAKEFEMGYYGQRGIMSGKIAIKIRDKDGNKVAYIGRNIKENGHGKYFFFKGYKSEHIFNLYRLREEKSCILTVSPFDVVKLSQEGQKNVVALLNHSMTREQEELLKQFESILLLHPEPDNIIQRLSRFSYVKAPKN
jgi:hypothetical protein